MYQTIGMVRNSGSRGGERIEHELSHSLILPAVAQTIRSILGLLEATHTALASRPPT
jgi:hypothetical protein